MGKRVRLTNESLNSYKTWVLTEGIDLTQFEKNSVLLYMHVRGNVIGYIKDIRIEEDNSLTGELVFDEASELSQRCKKQWELGSLKMVSIGIDILETSEDPKYLKPGQTCATITKSKLIEVSVVDIGANDDAIALHKDGVRLTLGKNAAEVLPPLHSNKQTKKGKKEMDKEKLALLLGMPKDTEESVIEEKLGQMLAKCSKVDSLEQQNQQLLASRIEGMVDAAVSEKKITLAQKSHFIGLGKKVGVEDLKKTLEAMSPAVKVSSMIAHAGADGHSAGEYKKLSDVPSDELAALKENDLELYKKLYKAEYGMEF